VATAPVREVGTTVGVLAVYTSDHDGIDGDERTLLEDDGTTLGYALRTADWILLDRILPSE